MRYDRHSVVDFVQLSCQLQAHLSSFNLFWIYSPISSLKIEKSRIKAHGTGKRKDTAIYYCSSTTVRACHDTQKIIGKKIYFDKMNIVFSHTNDIVVVLKVIVSVYVSNIKLYVHYVDGPLGSTLVLKSHLPP